MDKKTLELVNVYELTPEQLKELNLEEGDELSLFEGDPDFMVAPGANDDFITPENHVYFFIWSEKNLVVTSSYSDFDKELLEFCNGQDTSISRSGVNTRSEVGHWEYLEENNWEGWEECKNLKIAYRGGCGYVYTLFEYID